MKTVLSVQVPSGCPLACGFCRTPNHGVGDHQAVVNTVASQLAIGDFSELYITSNGETGLSPAFPMLLEIAKLNNIPVSVLCATEQSVVAGLHRVEVSLNDWTRPLALAAVKKAQSLGIPVVLSLVDTGNLDRLDLNQAADDHNVSGILVRALQAEGRSAENAGTTRYWQRPGVKLGEFPVGAYRELTGYGVDTVCINHFGDKVAHLGS